MKPKELGEKKPRPQSTIKYEPECITLRLYAFDENVKERGISGIQKAVKEKCIMKKLSSETDRKHIQRLTDTQVRLADIWSYV